MSQAESAWFFCSFRGIPLGFYHLIHICILCNFAPKISTI